MAQRRVLLVDDEIHVVSILERRFAQLGWEVNVCRDGEAALASLEEKWVPDIIIIDYQMPRLNGLETAEKLKLTELGGNVPIIMLSARGHLVDEQRLATTNIRMLLRKPFSAREVLAAAESVLETGSESAA